MKNPHIFYFQWWRSFFFYYFFKVTGIEYTTLIFSIGVEKQALKCDSSIFDCSAKENRKFEVDVFLLFTFFSKESRFASYCFLLTKGYKKAKKN